jgi:predicted nucleotidyltransferase
MATLDQASLSDVERRVLRRFVASLEKELGDDLNGVWLYGSRARGEPPHDESDVDLLVVTPRAGWDDFGRLIALLHEAAWGEGSNPWRFSVQVYEPERLARRREIRSFFIQEVDRDKIVLAGAP